MQQTLSFEAQFRRILTPKLSPYDLKALLLIMPLEQLSGSVSSPFRLTSSEPLPTDSSVSLRYPFLEAEPQQQASAL